MAKPKSFKAELNPALQFISIQDSESIQNEKSILDSENIQKKSSTINAYKQTTGYKINPKYLETKSKRVQLLMQPSLHRKLKKQADTNGVSVNEYIHSLLFNGSDTD